jgi:hypothetical protein
MVLVRSQSVRDTVALNFECINCFQFFHRATPRVTYSDMIILLQIYRQPSSPHYGVR